MNKPMATTRTTAIVIQRVPVLAQCGPFVNTGTATDRFGRLRQVAGSATGGSVLRADPSRALRADAPIERVRDMKHLW